MMRDSVQPRDRIYVQGYQLYLLQRIWVKILVKVLVKV